jgi:multimeric flavodoxin WrbA
MTQLLAVNGSYRDNGAIDQAISLAVQTATATGATVEVVKLRNFPIEFCRNCRQCTQTPGEAPGQCVQQDRMHELIAKIEAADGYILASPTNFSSVTAVFKRFMERLVVYGYWPFGMAAPKPRRKPTGKPAVLIASCAAPGLLGRVSFTTLKQLKYTAKTIGAKPVGSLFVGLVSLQEKPVLPDRAKRRLQNLIRKLL